MSNRNLHIFSCYFFLFLAGDALVAQQNWKERFLVIKVHENDKSKMQKNRISYVKLLHSY